MTLSEIAGLILLGLSVSSPILAFFLFRQIRRTKALEARFGPVVDLDAEAVKVQKELDRLNKEQKKLEKEFEERRSNLTAEHDALTSQLKQEYSQKRQVFERLLKELSVLEDHAEMVDFAMYQPVYDFESSERYKEERDRIRDRQKVMIKNKQAAICTTEWTVEGSRQKGKKMINQQIKLMLRAFNNECEAAILKVKWDNAEKMIARIEKAFEAINKTGEPQSTRIASSYLKLKLDELKLTHELKEKIQAEKEEQREMRERLREEEKVQKEIAKAQADAEKEEARSRKALEKALKEVEKAKGEELESLKAQIAALEGQVADAQALKERAVSRAQLTRSGNVYIISNVGSFGEEVFKIGMSRRLEPEERVKELSGPSVPFEFDIHAMIPAEDAPALETALHQEFRDKQVNRVNQRKEFFQVSLDEIEAAARRLVGKEVEVRRVVEAREFNETLALIKKEQQGSRLEDKLQEEFPAEL